VKDQSFERVLQALADSDSATLWIVDENLPLDTLAALRCPQSVLAVSNRYDTCKHLRALGVNTKLSDFDFTTLGQFDRVVYRLSKEKLLVHHCINNALMHLQENGELLLIGNKQDGMKSIARKTAETFGLRDSTKKMGSTYQAVFKRPQATSETGNRLPTNDYDVLRAIEHRGETFYSKPGVFGWDKVDVGSQLLVSTLPKVRQYMKAVNSVLDLGCGWGYLMLATRDWPEVSRRCATDNNMAAIAAASKNFAEQGMEVECLADDCASEIRERFDLILCNPPFHKGFSVNDSLTEKFLATASRLSRRSTRAVFVVNQFIALEKLSISHFSGCRLLDSADGFNVFELRP
jgi:16S rRNA (guanine1207-N2)-methyltransferase